ncbi:MAG TPA: glycosyltransferase family 4 protein [Vicinamibacterales bacterium]|nr:glycosyltransferase family 4 protein [Vicinamibacterales bacterium]
MTPLRICIVGLKCYDLLAERARPRYVGGAERQQVLLARGLAARGHQVTLVTLDHGQADGTSHAGVTVRPAYAAAVGVPVLRFFHPRWTGLVRAMRRADPGIVYQMGGDAETGQVALWCRASGRSFVFALASDADVDPALPLLRTRRQRVLYRAGLRRARAVVAQTEAQRSQLRAAFAVESTVIRNTSPDPGFAEDGYRQRAGNEHPRLLWVGRFVPVKRLEVLLDLAAAEPGWDFHVIGSAPGSDYGRSLEARAAALPNVTLHGGISDASLDEQYRRASVLLSTSSVEGVPTTFLEAWARGLPVVSTLDPDNVIASCGLGAVAAPDGLAAAVRAVMSQDPAALSRRIRAHYLATHTVDAYVARHEQLFLSLRR